MSVQETKIKVIHSLYSIEAFIFQTHWNFCAYGKCRKMISVILIICAIIYFYYNQISTGGFNIWSSLIALRESFFCISAVYSSRQYLLLIKQLRGFCKQFVQQRVYDLKPLVFCIILVYVIYHAIGLCLIYNVHCSQFICTILAMHSLFFMIYCERIIHVINDNFIALIEGVQKLHSYNRNGNSEEDAAFYEDFKPVPNAVDELEKIVDGYICMSSCCELFNSVFGYGIQFCMAADLILLIDSVALLWLARGEMKRLFQSVMIMNLIGQLVTLLLITAMESARERAVLLRCAVARFNNMLPEQGQLRTSTKYFIRLISKHPPRFGLVFELRASLIPGLVAQFVMYTIITIQFLGAL